MLLPYTALYQIVPMIIPSVLIDMPEPVRVDPGAARARDLVYIKQLAERVGYTFFLQPGPSPGMSVAYWGP